MEIIPFEERYRQAFIDFNTAWIRDHFGVVEPEDYHTFESIDERLADGGMIFVAVAEDKEPLALCMTHPMEGETWEMCKLGSNSERPHEGAGTAVFRACMDWAIAHGAKRLFIETNSSLAAAIHIYEKCGFTRILPYEPEYERGDAAFEYIVS